MSDFIDPLLCPLCHQKNHCVNIGVEDTQRTCWCNDPDIQFPQALLDQVPSDKKRKACICRNCAMAFLKESGVKTFDPK